MNTATQHDTVRNFVRDRYAQVAKSNETGCGCGPSCCGKEAVDPRETSARLGYAPDELDAVVDGANLGLGCGNPNAIAALSPGEHVLDLGSGAGFDSFLAGRRVGPTGRVIGVDMTPEMVSKARSNAARQGAANVEFRLGEIEALPVADASIDAILSNCVVNLSPDKPQVVREAFRVLRPGGRIALSDVVAFATIPAHVSEDLAAHSGCMAGAATPLEWQTFLQEAGFEEIRVEPVAASREVLKDWLPSEDVSNYLVSATIQAIRPAH